MHIVAQLPVGGGNIGLLPGGRFQFHYYQGQSIDEYHHVCPLFAVLSHCPLIGNGKAVLVRVSVIHQINQAGAFLTLYHIFYRRAVLQIVGKDHIFLQ